MINQEILKKKVRAYIKTQKGLAAKSEIELTKFNRWLKTEGKKLPEQDVERVKNAIK